MRTIDSLINSNPFWGVVALFFLVIGGAWKGDTVKATALFISWGVGLYVLYRFWSLQTAQDWRLLGGLALLGTGVVLLLYYGVDSHRQVSRPISGEPVGPGKAITAISLNFGGLPTVGVDIANPPDWHEPTKRLQLQRFAGSHEPSAGTNHS